MKLKLLTLSLLVPAMSANAALLLHYDFNSLSGPLANGAGVPEGQGSLDSNGTVGLGGGGTITATNASPPAPGYGSYLDIQPADDAHEGTGAPHFSTNQTIASLVVAGNNDYTMGAWVNWDNSTGDNMVFGGNSGDVIHNGARDANVHSGHWGDDLQGGNNDPGNWHHVVWTNTAAGVGVGGVQEIWVDGVMVASGAGAGATGGYTNNTGEQLLIGTSRNGGSFRGQLDDIRVYDNVLTPAEIQEWAAKVPEPSGIALIGLTGLALILRRRRF